VAARWHKAPVNFTLERMFRFLYSRLLTLIFLRGLSPAERRQMLGDLPKLSEREAFEALFLPGRALRRIAREDPRVLFELRGILDSANRIVPPNDDLRPTAVSLPWRVRVAFAALFAAIFALPAVLFGASALVSVLAGVVGGLAALSVSSVSVSNPKTRWPVLWVDGKEK
jgi:hypothetical protein